MSDKLPFLPHILILEARFYENIADNLKLGAIKTITEADGTYDLYQVPGALEIPAALKFAINGDNYHGFVVLGCVIRGETSHYEYVCQNSINRVQGLAVEYTLALGNGILTVENMKQAEDRANINGHNKGGFAAQTCLNMIRMKDQFGLFRG